MDEELTLAVRDLVEEMKILNEMVREFLDFLSDHSLTQPITGADTTEKK